MNILLTILLAVAGVIALLLIVAIFSKREHYVRREIIINAPRQKVFDYLKLLKNQDTLAISTIEREDIFVSFVNTGAL